MIRKSAYLAMALLGFCVLLTAQSSLGYQNDYGKDVQITADPSPVDQVTGSSVNQFGKHQTNSQIDNYIYQNEQINLDRFSGTVKVLRTNQKSLTNDYVTAIVPLKYTNPRELRGLARTICRKEGGDADVLQDFVSKQYYLAVVCPNFQLPYIMKTLHAIDHTWTREVNNGSWYTYYKGKNRDVRNILNVLQVYRSPDGTWDFDDANNAVLFYDQPNVEPLFDMGMKAIDIPPSQVSLDVAIYEVDTNNDLALGFDFESWKNGPGRDLFNLLAWNFSGSHPNNLFPGNAPVGASWGDLSSYNVLLTSAYIDFLQVKGKARLVTKSMITAKSGTVGDLAAVDQVATLQSTSDSDSSSLEQTLPYKLSDVYDYYQKQGQVAVPLNELLEMPASNVISAIASFLSGTLHANSAAISEITAQLSERVKDGMLRRNDLADIYVPQDIMLTIFHDRTLSYLQSGQVGVLLSVLPVVGLELAELSLALDVSDVNGLTPSGMPVIEHRYFSSEVEVKDGQPFVLSGIKRNAEVKSATGIPFLRDIWGLGYLFGNEVSTKQEKNLVVLITPRFKLCQTSEATPPKEIQAAINLVNNREELKVPRTSIGFDQWLLDN